MSYESSRSESSRNSTPCHIFNFCMSPPHSSEGSFVSRSSTPFLDDDSARSSQHMHTVGNIVRKTSYETMASEDQGLHEFLTCPLPSTPEMLPLGEHLTTRFTSECSFRFPTPPPAESRDSRSANEVECISPSQLILTTPTSSGNINDLAHRLMATDEERTSVVQTPRKERSRSRLLANSILGFQTCPTCGKHHSNLSVYRRHLKAHGEIQWVCQNLGLSDGTSLESCGTGFKDQPTLMDHINRVHNTRHVESAVRINIVPSLMRAISVQKIVCYNSSGTD